MTATWAILQDTFREASARKLVWGLFGISTLIVAFFLFVLQMDVVQGGRMALTVFGQPDRGSVDVQKFVHQAYAFIGGFLMTFALLMAIFSSSGLVASMLDQGRIELLLSKPVSRWHLLLGRYAGNVMVIAVNAMYLVGGIWLILGMKTGVWDARFLWSILISVALFAIYLAVIVLVGVLFESGALAIMVCVGLLIVTSLLGQVELARKLLSSEEARQVWVALYWVLPKTSDIAGLNYRLIMGQDPGSWLPVATSVAFGAAVLAWAASIFEKRDF
jgi:ABC-type transport system involved in multi-copper enzyme maturation permease subunit